MDDMEMNTAVSWHLCKSGIFSHQS